MRWKKAIEVELEKVKLEKAENVKEYFTLEDKINALETELAEVNRTNNDKIPFPVGCVICSASLGLGILAQVQSNAFAIINLKRGNRWTDPVTCMPLLSSDSGFSLSKKDVDKMVGGTTRSYTKVANSLEEYYESNRS